MVLICVPRDYRVVKVRTHLQFVFTYVYSDFFVYVLTSIVVVNIIYF